MGIAQLGTITLRRSLLDNSNFSTTWPMWPPNERTSQFPRWRKCCIACPMQVYRSSKFNSSVTLSRHVPKSFPFMRLKTAYTPFSLRDRKTSSLRKSYVSICCNCILRGIPYSPQDICPYFEKLFFDSEVDIWELVNLRNRKQFLNCPLII